MRAHAPGPARLRTVPMKAQKRDRVGMATSTISSSNMPGVTLPPRLGRLAPVDADATLGDRAQVGQSRQDARNETIVARRRHADAPFESRDQCVSFEVLTSNLGNPKLEAGLGRPRVVRVAGK